MTIGEAVGREEFCDVGRGVTLCYESFGDPEDPAMLLVMGLATQMIAWHTSFIELLVERGLRVVRFDNRDIGRSTRMTGVPTPTLRQLLARRVGPRQYDLGDMGADTVGLMDGLGIRDAHLVGASMGGMIAQTVAARYPDRTRSLTSIMSNTGSRVTGQPGPGMYPVLLRRPAGRGREDFVDHIERVFGKIGSPGQDAATIREHAGLSFDRGVDADGPLRQLGAIAASGARAKELRKITAPTLVIHGKADRLVPLSGGKATARAIPGAKLMVVEGMGHDLPERNWPRIVDAIVANAAVSAPAS